MKFGPLPTDQALGAFLAHSVALSDGRLRKGLCLGPDQIAQLQAAGITEVTVAQLAPSDVHEDAAAAQLAKALVPDPEGAGLRIGIAGTGRVNIFARGPGIVSLDSRAITAANMIDPGITVATLAPHRRVSDGAMVATVKIIPYGVPRDALSDACAAAHGALTRRAPLIHRASLILTHVDQSGPAPDLSATAIEQRLERMGCALDRVVTVPHDVGPLAEAIAAAGTDLILILTASATSDINDTAPMALRQAGGQVTRFGVPVDPGNLLFTGQFGAASVIGLPGCARSPALNGADWFLERTLCGVPILPEDIAAMGVGGLLKEIPERGRPRNLKGP